MVRIGRDGDEVSVYRAYLADWQLLYDALAAANFWSLSPDVPSRGLWLDGHDITVEGRRGEAFKATTLRHPDVDELRQLGRVAFDLAGLAEVRL